METTETVKKSKYTGVTWDGRAGKWRARILAGGEHRSLGQFENELDAAEAYNKAAAEKDADEAEAHGRDVEVEELATDYDNDREGREKHRDTGLLARVDAGAATHEGEAKQRKSAFDEEKGLRADMYDDQADAHEDDKLVRKMGRDRELREELRHKNAEARWKQRLLDRESVKAAIEEERERRHAAIQEEREKRRGAMLAAREADRAARKTQAKESDLSETEQWERDAEKAERKAAWLEARKIEKEGAPLNRREKWEQQREEAEEKKGWEAEEERARLALEMRLEAEKKAQSWRAVMMFLMFTLTGFFGLANGGRGLALLALYWTPTFLAGIRKHPRFGAIFYLNAFLGITGVGWIAALAWALKRKQAGGVVQMKGPSPKPGKAA